MASDSPVILTEGLSRSFGTHIAVEDLHLSVPTGEIYGFLGLNGAGKTTTIRMLTGMIRPDSGRVFLLDREIQPGRLGPWDRVGCLVESPAFYPELTVNENLSLLARGRGLPPERINRVCGLLRLDKYRRRRAGHLSLGNVQRLGLAMALIHQPRLLLLDEPTNGLDPAGIVEIRDLLRDLARNQGVTVFVSSHILAEMARLADRVGVIHEGRLVRELAPTDLSRLMESRWLVRWRNAGMAEQANKLLRERGIMTRPGEDTATRILSFPKPDGVAQAEPLGDSTALVEFLVGAGVPPAQFWRENRDLEDYFLGLVAPGSVREAGSAAGNKNRNEGES